MENLLAMVATDDNLQTIARDNDLVLPKTIKYINAYTKTVKTAVKSAWNLCEVITKTVNAPDFKNAFKTREIYGKCLGLSKSTISKYERVIAVRDTLIAKDSTLAEDNGLSENFSNITVGQAAELIGIPLDELYSFCHNNDITDKTSAKKIREFVKIYNNGLPGDNEEESEEVNEIESDEEENENDTTNNNNAKTFNAVVLTCSFPNNVNTEYVISFDNWEKVVNVLKEYDMITDDEDC